MGIKQFSTPIGHWLIGHWLIIGHWSLAHSVIGSSVIHRKANWVV
jgi:hypothetical protein